MPKFKGVLASSSDPSGQTLSNTVQGLVIVLSAIVPMIGMQFFHVQLSSSDVGSFVTEIGALIGVIMTLRGIVMKFINAWGTVPPVQP